jgi:anthranilate/para-aminobenzoate synthase component I
MPIRVDNRMVETSQSQEQNSSKPAENTRLASELQLTPRNAEHAMLVDLAYD